MGGAIYLMFLVGISAGFLGVFIILKNQAMIIDAISHSIFLGVVLGIFYLRKQYHSVPTAELITDIRIILIASIFGFISVGLIELITKTKLVKEDSAMGIVFPFIFSIAMFIVIKHGKGLHIDPHSAVNGNLYAEILKTKKYEIAIPSTKYSDIVNIKFTTIKSIIPISIITILVIAYIVLIYKELSVSTFDEIHSRLSGFSINIIHYSLMFLVSFVSVSVFNIVGVIVSISFFTAIPAAAMLYAKRVKGIFITIIILSIFVVILSIIIAALAPSISILGLVGSLNGIVFLFAWLTNRNGYIRYLFKKRSNKLMLMSNIFIVHIRNHEGTDEEESENELETIRKHMNWTKKDMTKNINYMLKNNYININNKVCKLTKSGKERYEQIKSFYNFKNMKK